MNRRDILSMSSVGVFVGVAGCIESHGSEGDEPTESHGSEGDEPENEYNTNDPAEKREFPDPPSELSVESAKEYVGEYEAVYQHNELVDGDRLRITADCPPVLDHVAEDGYYVSTVCFVTESNDGGVGQLHSEPVLYFVTSEETIRIEPEPHEYDEPYLEEGQYSTDARGLWLSNFDDDAHELSVRIVHETAEDSITVLDETYNLPARDGLLVKRVAGIDGDYEVRAELTDGTGTAETFYVSSSGWVRERIGAVHITPDGDVTIRPIEFERAN